MSTVAEPTGILFNESNEVYHSRKAVSNSKLGVARKSLELYKKKFIDKSIPHESSAAMNFGTHGHCFILEGERVFNERYRVLPDVSFALNTTKGKDNYIEFLMQAVNDDRMPNRECEMMIGLIRQKSRNDEEKKVMTTIMGQYFISYEEMAKLQNAKEGIEKNPDAVNILRACQPEVTFRTPMTSYGFQVQCRADAYSVNGCEYSEFHSFAADLKTIDDLDNFDQRFYNLGYYRQGPFYAKVINALSPEQPIKTFYFVFVEKKEPFRCRVFESDVEAWEYGMKEVDSDLSRLGKAYRREIPWHDQTTKLVGLKPWHRREIDDRLSA